MTAAKLVALTCCLLMTPLVADAEPPSKADLAQAERLLRKGNAHYAAKRYQRAIDAYREAHTVSQAPGFLFNIAQVYRVWGKCREAITHYEEFLAADPNTALRPQVERFLRELWTCIESEPDARQAEPAPQPDPPPSTAEVGAEPAAAAPAIRVDRSTDDRTHGTSSSAWRWVGIGTAAAGLAAAGTGIYFGLEARSASRDVEGFSGEWGPEQRALEQTAQSNEKRAWLLGIAGAAACVSGAALYLLAGDEDAQPSSNLTIAPTARGGVLVWSFVH